MDENLSIYNLARIVPDNAQKTISAGRLKGMTDINPMWRIKRLTELFGPCGIGWWYTIDRQWMEESEDAGEIAAFCNITLYYVWNGATSQGISGTGGSAFVAKEKNGPHMSDECFKMALTDAISVAAKAIGIGADVYWDKDRSKYNAAGAPPAQSTPAVQFFCTDCGKEIKTTTSRSSGVTRTAEYIASQTEQIYGRCLCMSCANKQSAAGAGYAD